MKNYISVKDILSMRKKALWGGRWDMMLKLCATIGGFIFLKAGCRGDSDCYFVITQTDYTAFQKSVTELDIMVFNFLTSDNERPKISLDIDFCESTGILTSCLSPQCSVKKKRRKKSLKNNLVSSSYALFPFFFLFLDTFLWFLCTHFPKCKKLCKWEELAFSSTLCA